MVFWGILCTLSGSSVPICEMGFGWSGYHKDNMGLTLGLGSDSSGQTQTLHV